MEVKVKVIKVPILKILFFVIAVILVLLDRVSPWEVILFLLWWPNLNWKIKVPTE